MTVQFPMGNIYTGNKIRMPDGSESYVDANRVSATYFETLGLKALDGRVFEPGDTHASPIVVVNRAFVKKYGAATVGQFINTDKRDVQIVGVVADVNYHGDSHAAPGPMMYVISDTPLPWLPISMLLRTTSGNEANAAATVRAAIRERYPDLVAPTIEPVRNRIARDTKPQRMMGNAALGVGATELALSAIGLYGLLMFALHARRREIGVRLAIGSSAHQASWAVLRDGLRYAGIGAVCGIILCIPASVAASNTMPGVVIKDPVPFIVALFGVLAAVAIAAFLPARRASRVDPMIALRND